MEISSVKRLILEKMWMLDKPAKAYEIAKETAHGFPSVMMHLIWLTRMGYVTSPEKGLYEISERGRKALGLREVEKGEAGKILARLPPEKWFHFYADIGKPLNSYAQSLEDFCDKVLKIDADSIKFHTSRGDFEAWFKGLGDLELARRMALAKEKGWVGDEQRRKIYEVVKKRCRVLAAMVGRTVTT
ncbi:MAG: hypothetical protein ACUVUE_02415 [Candidatus Bathycorpusculaceae bacterium]